MRGIIALLLLCWGAAANAGSFWIHNGSEVELLESPNAEDLEDATREIQYFRPRPGLAVAQGTVLFQGSATGNQYSGTAYVFSTRCGAVGYNVSGTANAHQRSIVLYGQAPVLGPQCNIIGYRDDVLVFSYNGTCGCVCGDHAEFSSMYPPKPNYTGSTASAEGASCPYLYAWSDRDLQWHSYGKVIRDARTERREMTEVIELAGFATKFRLVEKEPEHSFIDRVELKVMLKDGSQVILRPTSTALTKQDKKRVYIPAFGTAEFKFKVPPWITPDTVKKASLSITGYYEELSGARVCRRPIAASKK